MDKIPTSQEASFYQMNIILQSMDSLREEWKDGRKEIREDISKVRTEIKESIAQVQSEMKDTYVSKVEFTETVGSLNLLADKVKGINGGIVWATRTAITSIMTGVVGIISLLVKK